MLDDIKAAPFDAQAAKGYGPIRAAYKDRNREALDKLIASRAVALGVTLVTNNEADFVNDAGLRVENWVSNHRDQRRIQNSAELLVQALPTMALMSFIKRNR